MRSLTPQPIIGSSSSAASSANGFNRALLRRYYTALADRASNPLDIVFIGDSITEGARTESVFGARWTDRLMAALRARFQPSGVTGGYYIPASPSYTLVLPSVWSFSGTNTPQGTDGLGYYSNILGSAATATLTFTGTSIKVFYSALAGASTATVTIDGSAVASINGATGAPNYGASVTYGGLAAGSHTIVITNGTGNLTLQGAYYFNGDETKGLRMWNGGHAGIGSDSFPKFIPASIAPDLAVIALGVNDYRLAANDPTHTNTNITALIKRLQAEVSPAPSVIVMAMYEPSTNSGTTPLGSWASYVAAMTTAANQNGALFLDLEPLFAASGVPVPGDGMMATDTGPAYVHPTLAGHQLIADYLVALLGA